MVYAHIIDIKIACHDTLLEVSGYDPKVKYLPYKEKVFVNTSAEQV